MLAFMPCRAAMELDWVADVSSLASCWITLAAQIPLTICIVYWYTTRMLKSYRHKGIKQFAETGSKAGIQPEHANRLRRLLSALDAATCPANMNAPGYALHPLKGELEGHWAVRVSGNWRLTFAFEGEDAILVDYQDYH
jgi:toxin HigB-1